MSIEISKKSIDTDNFDSLIPTRFTSGNTRRIGKYVGVMIAQSISVASHAGYCRSSPSTSHRFLKVSADRRVCATAEIRGRHGGCTVMSVACESIEVWGRGMWYLKILRVTRSYFDFATHLASICVPILVLVTLLEVNPTSPCSTVP